MDDYEDKPTRLKNTKHLRKIQRKRDSGQESREMVKSSKGRKPVEQPRKNQDWLRDSLWELDDL